MNPLHGRCMPEYCDGTHVSHPTNESQLVASIPVLQSPFALQVLRCHAAVSLKAETPLWRWRPAETTGRFPCAIFGCVLSMQVGMHPTVLNCEALVARKDHGCASMPSGKELRARLAMKIHIAKRGLFWMALLDCVVCSSGWWQASSHRQ